MENEYHSEIEVVKERTLSKFVKEILLEKTLKLLIKKNKNS